MLHWIISILDMGLRKHIIIHLDYITVKSYSYSKKHSPSFLAVS